jgi:hypothetical protein
MEKALTDSISQASLSMTSLHVGQIGCKFSFLCWRMVCIHRDGMSMTTGEARPIVITELCMQPKVDICTQA